MHSLLPQERDSLAVQLAGTAIERDGQNLHFLFCPRQSSWGCRGVERNGNELISGRGSS